LLQFGKEKMMNKGKFRPCIDIHGGQVKQIVGGSLSERSGGFTVKNMPPDKTSVNVKFTGSSALINFVSDKDAAYYAKLYKAHNLPGGHIIILNKKGTPEYAAGLSAAKSALAAFPGGMSIGGGIEPENALEFPDASAVIVTSYVFSDGKVNFPNLEKISTLLTPSRLILDLSVREIDGSYRITTDRWQKITNTVLSGETLANLSEYCSEYLIHAVDKEGKRGGIDKKLTALLSEFTAETGFPVTYAGGVRDMADAEFLSEAGLDFTVGSALDIFGGNLSFEELAEKFS
jgi:phosphoribosylformimino-5-aminoimidazole carboxamide ribotide isomerase